MKIIICFLAILVFADATQTFDPIASRSLSSTAEAMVVKIRDRMPCGFPKAGIPPLAPLVINHHEVNIDTPALRVSGYLDKCRVIGANDFEIKELKIHVFKSKAYYKFHFNNINLDTGYEFESFLNKAGFTINLKGAGHAKFAIKDLEIWGTSKYVFAIATKKIKLKTLEVRAHIGSVESDIKGIMGHGAINKRMNYALEEAAELLVNENEDFIAETIESRLLPMVNGILSNTTLPILTASLDSDIDCELSNE